MMQVGGTPRILQFTHRRRIVAEVLATADRAAMNLIQNERAKYLATLINTIAAASVIAGVIAPLVAVTYSLPSPMSEGRIAVAISVAWLLIGAVLHYAVRLILGRLRE